MKQCDGINVYTVQNEIEHPRQLVLRGLKEGSAQEAGRWTFHLLVVRNLTLHLCVCEFMITLLFLVCTKNVNYVLKYRLMNQIIKMFWYLYNRFFKNVKK
jgi:hypothetical protein